MQHRDLIPQDSHSPSQERVENSTGSTIPALRCVKYVGYGVDYPTISISSPGDDVRGITIDPIANGTQGYILAYGALFNLDTSAWAPGTSLYCGPGGVLTDVSNGPQVANVLKQHATLGVIFVTCLDTPAAMTASVQDTDSIDMDTVGLIIKSDLVLSSAPATTNHLKATTTIKSGAQKGLHVEYPFADATTDGVLRATDWDTFYNRVEQTDPRLSVANVLKVKKNPGTGEFATISAALSHAITAGPSSINRFIILVAPGTYTEPLLNIPSWVYVVGYDTESVIVTPAAATHHVFKITQNSGISSLTITNAGAGYAGVVIENPDSDAAFLHKLHIKNCSIGIIIQTTVAATGNHYAYVQNIKYTNCSNKCIDVTTSGGSATLYTNISDANIYTELASTASAMAFDGNIYGYISGGSILRSGTALGDAIIIQNNAIINIHSTQINQWDNAIAINANGTGYITSATFIDCNTNVYVSHATASGYITGYSEYLKLNIHPNSSFFVTYKDANIITVAKKGGDFDSIKNAVDSITTNSSTNRYVILVHPGIYVENQIILKPYVMIRGVDKNTCIIESNNPAIPLIIGSENAELSELQLRNSTTSLISYNGTISTSDSFEISHCLFSNTDTIFSVNAAAASRAKVNIKDCKAIDSSIDKILLLNGTVGIEVTVTVANFDYLRTNSPYASVLFEVQGGAARLFLYDGSYITNSTVSDGVRLLNGASAILNSTYLQGFATAIEVQNVGSASSINTSNIIIKNSTNDIIVDHPAATGTINAIADSSKITIDPNSTVTVTLTSNLLDGGMLVSGPLRIGREYSYNENVLDLLEGEPGMGVLNGGQLSDGGGFTVNVAAGFGYAMVQDFDDHRIRRISWNDTSITLSANQDVYIYFNNSGVLSSSAFIANSATVVLLGRIVTNSTGIELIERSPLKITHNANNIDQLLRDALGPIYESGSIVTENTTPFRLNVTAGVYYFAFNRYTPTGGTAINFTEYYRDGLGGWNRSVTNIVNSTQYDNNSGSLVSLSANHFTKHALYVNCDGAVEKYFLVIGQAQYAALAAAEEAPLPTLPPWIKDAISPVAAIIIKQGDTGIHKIIDIRPRIGFSATAVSASADHGNLLGLSDDDHPQYLLVDGSRAMSGDLNLGGNDITNVNLVDGVDVSAHAARHLPSGADPLDTAAPIGSLGADTLNSVGIANSLARSDHTHAIATGVPSTITPDQANSAGTSNNLARADHIHNIPADAPTTTLSPVTTNAEGTGTSFARNDHTHAIATAITADITTILPDDTASAGTANNYARGDHRHAISTAVPITINADGTNAQGTSTSFARADHKHNIATGAPSTITPDQANSAGTSSSLARADHIHNIPADAPTTTLSPTTTNAEGTGTAFARNDHTHAIATAATADITTILPDDTASAGTTNNYARGDHRHAISTDAPTTTLSPTTTNAEGTGTAFARNDHTHAIATAITADITTILPDSTASAGTANNYARGDHRHAISTDVPVNTGTSNLEGTSNSFARADHVHDTVIGRSAIFSNTTFSASSTTDVLITGFSITPPAGTYLILVSMNINKTGGAGSNILTASIYRNGVQLSLTERVHWFNGNNQPSNLAIIHSGVAVSGTDTIDVRIRSSTGHTMTIGDRSLIAVRLGP